MGQLHHAEWTQGPFVTWKMLSPRCGVEWPDFARLSAQHDPSTRISDLPQPAPLAEDVPTPPELFEM
jgi:hypothetical protein